MSDLLAADLSLFWPTHTTSTPTGKIIAHTLCVAHIQCIVHYVHGYIIMWLGKTYV